MSRPTMRISADLEDWDDMRDLANNIIKECKRQQCLTFDYLQWKRNHSRMVSTFSVIRDTMHTQFTVPDEVLNSWFGPDWDKLIVDYLVTTMKTRKDPNNLPPVI